ncbi:homoserine kinase [Bowdeniella nasicola]|uniref:Homoserine kinase n=1 Tax=Bowdeniella nasicola TaxID=208480 RepID=A0A1Q5Q301_9ACTO|nr:homoserine kinase [Bowdeniella nasicola]OKL54211.1 homoserine kinase [Bowdeniella nasicola]
MQLRYDDVEVSVPATSANLGPGFDCLGLALDLRDKVRARAITGPSEVRVTGEGSRSIPTGEDHLVVRAIRIGLDFAGAPQVGLSLVCRNAIPHGRGLGSSAAAVVAGLMIARQMVDNDEALGLDSVLHLASEMEGHPDNAAPAIHGGVRLAWMEGGAAQSIPLPISDHIRPTVIVPSFEVSTSRARHLLPPTVPFDDAAFTAARAAMLVAALQDPTLLLSATEDRLHQPYRREVLGASLEVVDQLRARGLPAVISGAGPTVLVLGELDHVTTTALRTQRWRVWPTPVDTRGAVVAPVGA